MVATIHKRYLLDTEFFGQKADVEYVDIGADSKTGKRSLSIHSLDTLPLWSEARLTDRLSLIAEAIEYVRAAGVVAERKRIRRRPDPELPLFD